VATYVEPTTRADGFVVDAAEWNKNTVENIKYFKDAPNFDGVVTFDDNVGLTAAKKLFLDGIADTFIWESTSNTLSLVSGGVSVDIASGVVTLKANPATYGLIGDGTNGVGIAATHASGALRFYAGGTTKRWEISTSGNLMPGANDSYAIGDNSTMVSRIHISGANPVYLPNISASSGTTLIVDGDGNMKKLSSSRRYKEHVTPWLVSADALSAFVALSPELWDYIGQPTGAAGFLSEALASVPIHNAYGRSPLVNYDADGRPESNRDFAVIGLQHLVLQQHDARIAALEARLGQ